MHIPAPGFHAAFVSTVELVCGVLLIIGLGTRAASALLIISELCGAVGATDIDAPAQRAVELLTRWLDAEVLAAAGS